MLDKLGGRKSLALIVILVIGAIVTSLKGDIPVEFSHFLEIMFGIFVGGNVGSKAFYKTNDNLPVASSDNSSDSIAELQKTNIAISELHKTNISITQGISLVQQILAQIVRKTGIDRMPEPPVS